MRELEDFEWFPETFRQHQMDFLTLLALKFKLYLPVKKDLFEILDIQIKEGWTDACSGSGGPVQSLAGNYPVLLTDLYPSFNHLNLPKNLDFLQTPMDITRNLPPGNGLITIFNSFHHFSEEQQDEIIKKCSASGRALMAVEILQPGPLSFFLVLLTTTIGHWMMVPFMKPFSLKRLFFTYLLPIYTLAVAYDGIISVFKSKSRRYFEKLAKQNSLKDYRVDFVKIRGPFGPLFIIKGLPVT